MSRLRDTVGAWLGLPSSEEQRTITAEALWGDQVPFNYGGTLASTFVVSPEKALTLGPVYAANRLIADSTATLPLKSYRKLGSDRVPMKKLPPLLDAMKEDGSLIPWLYRCVTSLGLRGNAYGYIVARDGYEYPTQVDWLNPTDVTPDLRLDSRGGWLVRGRSIPREDIIHIVRFAQAGSRVGLSPIGAFAATLGIALSAQTYTAEWFEAGGFPPGTFKNEEKVVNQQEAEIIKSRLTSSIRTRQPIVYGKDWTYNPITVPPEEAQFIGTMKLTASQIAAIYGVPPEMIGGETGTSLTYANVEQNQINFVMFTLRPWLEILEAAFSALMPHGQYLKFNGDALIRADLRTRWDVSKIRVELGAASVNEIRAQEDQEPIAGGDSYKSAATLAADAAKAASAAQPSQPAQQNSNPGDVTPIRRIQ